MCLKEISFEGEVPQYYKSKKTGYKIFEAGPNGTLKTKFRNLKGRDVGLGGSTVRYGKEYSSTDGDIRLSFSYRTYPAGFHIYSNKSDAIDRCEPGDVVVEVSYKDPVCIGVNSWDDKFKTIIARKMTLIRRIYKAK